MRSPQGLTKDEETEQDWNDEKLATKLTKDDQQPVLLLPARWWPDTLPEFEIEGWCKCQKREQSVGIVDVAL